MSRNHWEDGNILPSQTGGMHLAGLAPAGASPLDGLFLLPVVGASAAVQPRLSIIPSANVNAETGEISKISRWGRSATSAAIERGVFKNAAQEPLAPHSITGAKNSKHETGAFIDWISCIFRGEGALEKACVVFGAGQEWTPLERGGYKYDNSLRRGDVTIYHGGQFYNQGVMQAHNTVLVVASGKGCRQLEEEGLISGFGSEDTTKNPWRLFLADLLALGCTFPRLDVAIDDRDGLLNLDTIEQNLDADLCCMRAQQYERRRPKKAGHGITGDTITIGNRQSLMFVRIYNKHKEQIVLGELPPDAPEEPWIRCELEAHNEKATKLAGAIVQFGMQSVAAVLWSTIDFKSSDGDEEKHNRRRRETADWWKTFIDVTAKLNLKLAPKVRTLEKVYKWVASQVAPSLALLDCLPNGHDILSAIIQAGGERLRAPHFAMLKTAKTGGLIDFSRPYYALG